MRRSAATWLVLAACGINPAFEPSTPGTSAGPDTSAPPDPSTGPAASTGPAPTTSVAGSTSGVGATGPDDTSTTSATTSTDATTTTATTTLETTDAATDVPCPKHPNLLACYTFPDGAGDDLIDGSPNQYDGVKLATDQVPSLGDYAYAAGFTPDSDVYVPYREEMNTPHFAVSLFAHIDPGPAYRPLVDKHDQLGLFAGDGNVRCIVKNQEDPPKTVMKSVPTGTWVHITCMFDGAEVRLRIFGDGAPPDPGVAPLTGIVNNDAKSELRLGNAPPSPTKFNGKLDHVLVFSEALDDDTVCELAGPLCP